MSSPHAQSTASAGSTGEPAWAAAMRVMPQARGLLLQASRRQKVLLALALVVPALLAGLYAYHQYSEVLSEAHDSARRSVVALEQHAANVVDTHALVLRQLDVLTHGRTVDQIRNDELLKLSLSGFSRELTQILTIGITDHNGNVISNSWGPKAEGLSVEDRDYFIAHRKGAPIGIFVSEAFTGRTTGQRQFALSIRRTLPNGEFGGVIFTTVPLAHFIDFWRGFTPEGGHLIPMVRPDGALIVRYPRIESPPNLDPRGPFITHLTRSRKGLYTAVSQVDGVERINAYSQVKNYPLFISFSVESKTVAQGWRRQVLAASTIAALVAGLLVALWVVAMRQSLADRMSAARWEATALALQEEVARRQEAEESLRLGAKRISFGDQLIGIVSHDLRNPLNTISLTAALIMRRDALGPQDAQLVQRIQNAAHRAAGLIRDLLDFTQARLGGRIPLQVRSTNIHELLQRVLTELEAAYPDRIDWLAGAEDPRGTWDPDRLAQVVENLVINALKYGAPGSKVRVATFADETSVSLQVHNEGAPIPPEKIPVIFEPLQRGSEASQPNPERSIGLGLFIVRHIVEAHAGSLRVDSAPERGTTFTACLPRSMPPPAL
jgi:signal transduction histidine kinase